MISDKQKKLIKAFSDSNYYRPNFSQISKDTGLSVSNVFEFFNKHKDWFRFGVKVKSLGEILEEEK